jgi:hypothetical protein
MDLLKVKKNAILVPTPGQTEQEWLGWYLFDRKWMYVVQQKDFSMEKALNDFQKMEFSFPEIHDSLLPEAVDDLIKKSFKN